MFTQEEKDVLVHALVAQKSSTERSKAKARNPKFSELYVEHLRLLASLTMKVQALEVDNGKGKVTPR